jgi:hypothetical protein
MRRAVHVSLSTHSRPCARARARKWRIVTIRMSTTSPREKYAFIVARLVFAMALPWRPPPPSALARGRCGRPSSP